MTGRVDYFAGYRGHLALLDACCLRCGGVLGVENVGKVIGGRETVGILRCGSCDFPHHLRVALTPMVAADANVPPTRNFPAICGTDSGYFRHLRHDETACVACREAHAEYAQRLSARKGVTV